MGRHQWRAPVFADQSGQRTRMTSLVVRSLTVLVVGGMVALVVTLLSGVPLPGLTAPARAPSGERPVPHAEPTAITPTGAVPMAVPTQTPPGSGTTGAAFTPPGSATAPAASTTPVAATVSATPTHGNRTTPASTSASPSRTHGRGRPTPPGRTKHP